MPSDRAQWRHTVRLVDAACPRGAPDHQARPPERTQRQAVGEIAVPVFGYKNHLAIDRAHGFGRDQSPTPRKDRQLPKDLLFGGRQ